MSGNARSINCTSFKLLIAIVTNKDNATLDTASRAASLILYALVKSPKLRITAAQIIAPIYAGSGVRTDNPALTIVPIPNARPIHIQIVKRS